MGRFEVRAAKDVNRAATNYFPVSFNFKIMYAAINKSMKLI